MIEAEIYTGQFKAEKEFIRRINLFASDSESPFDLRLRQFLIKLSFSMTLNKSQGQTLIKVGIYLPDPVFTHGLLYVALARVSSLNSITIFYTGQNSTKNIVYKDIFQYA